MTHSGGDLLWKICSRCHGLVVIFQIWWLVVVEYGCTWESGCRSIFCTDNLKVNSSPPDPWSQNTEYKAFTKYRAHFPLFICCHFFPTQCRSSLGTYFFLKFKSQIYSTW